MENHSNNYGDNFQQKSKYIRGKIPAHYLDWANKPKVYKTYPNAIETISLPNPELNDSIRFWNTLNNRRSTRKIKDDPSSLMELSKILFGITGLTRKFPQFAFRTVPSAGGLYPIETYPVINNVEGMNPGIYH
jgi:hypothetical protein